MINIKEKLNEIIKTVYIITAINFYLLDFLLIINSIFLYIILGRKPEVFLDNPNNIVFNNLHGIFILLLINTIYILPLFIIAIIISIIIKLKKELLKIILCIISIIIFIILMWLDLLSYITWLLD